MDPQPQQSQPHPDLTPLQSQLQFYFSPVNLATDCHLRTLLSHKTWIPASYFLCCRRIQSLLTSMHVSRGPVRQDRLVRSVRDSDVLEVRGRNFRRREKYVHGEVREKLCYVEFGAGGGQRIRQKLGELEGYLGTKIGVKVGEKWMFLLPAQKHKQLINILNQRKDQLGITTVLDAEQLGQAEKKYEKILSEMRKYDGQKQVPKKKQSWRKQYKISEKPKPKQKPRGKMQSQSQSEQPQQQHQKPRAQNNHKNPFAPNNNKP